MEEENVGLGGQDGSFMAAHALSQARACRALAMHIFFSKNKQEVPQNVLQHSPDKELPGLAGEEVLREFLIERLRT